MPSIITCKQKDKISNVASLNQPFFLSEIGLELVFNITNNLCYKMLQTQVVIYIINF